MEDEQTSERAAWEYRLVPMGNPPPPGVEERANALGAQGWELVAIDAGIWVFKRPTSPAADADPLVAVLEETVPLTAPGALPPAEAVGPPPAPPA